MIALGPIFQAVGAVVDLIIEAVENFSYVYLTVCNFCALKKA